MQLYPPVTSADVLNILETPTTDPKTVVDTLRIQYELVLTFASIQSQANSNIRDAAWVEMLSSSRLATVIERTFVHAGRSQSEDAKDVDMMRNVLLAITQAGTGMFRYHSEERYSDSIVVPS
ncbi:hypothetical protein EUX98_g2393 [Antrodiella citrinella]|uniref:Uncharacterized protein n=1 Tax=Antrodiella citrinella TaxID=2447956 RepID=A0A4S4N7E4_9APHY|nr:hypothetical protein EUX98_g2393 [Antrodiella citrinella]